MPFTISHAAAALPLGALARRRLPMAALMIGAMSPDFAYFPPLQVARMNTHDLAGIFEFCWPVGMVVWLVYVLLVERPTIALLPDDWRTRLAPTAPLSFPLLAFASLALMLGAASHIAWDAFTHARTVVVDALPPLHEIRFDVGDASVPLYFVLQYASSVAGLAALAIWGWCLRRAPTLPPEDVVPGVSARMRSWALGSVLFTTCAFAGMYAVQHEALGPGNAFFYFLIGGMTGVAVGWCAVAVGVRFAQRAGLTAPAN